MKISEILLEEIKQTVDLDRADRDFVPPKKTIKAYKLFKISPKHPRKLFPLFVNTNDYVEIGKWYEAKSGQLSKTGKVKSKIGDLAYRPGWHAGDYPIATHIGDLTQAQIAEKERIDSLRKSEIEKAISSLEFKGTFDNVDDATKRSVIQKITNKINKQIPYSKGTTVPSLRPANQVWAEVEMPADFDWQSEANKRGINPSGELIPGQAHITDQIPKGGHYRYKTNPNMTGNWIIGGAMKVTRVLSDEEVDRLNLEGGFRDLPRETPLDLKKYGF